MTTRPDDLTASPQPATGALTPREQRQRAVSDARRDLILAAARSAYFELGLEGVSMREIAKRAGYTAGALYSYFPSKEDVYAALLGESLERLNRQVAQAFLQEPGGREPGTGRPSQNASEFRLRSHARAFFDFYAENPRDLDLGFYLFNGMQPRGLTPELNGHLNSRLRDALEPTRLALVQLGVDEDEAQTEVTALFAHIVGLLVLSHTGRIRMFRREAAGLFERYLDALVMRCARPSPQSAA